MKAPLFAVAAVAACFACADSAKAQLVTYYYPPAATQVVSYSPVVAPASPVVYTTGYAPVYTVARPVVATTTVAPTAVVRTRTRYRPLRPFRGPVTRVRYRYAPVTTYYAY